MLKRLISCHIDTPLWIVWRRPWQSISRGHDSSPANTYTLYWSSIFVTALLVSLYQFFSILPAREVIIRMAMGVLIVYGAGYAFLYAFSYATQALLTTLHYPQSPQQVAEVVMSSGPWIAGITFLAVVTSRYWVCDIAGLLAVLFLIKRLAMAMRLSFAQAALVISIEWLPVLAALLYLSWVRGWNFFPFW